MECFSDQSGKGERVAIGVVISDETTNLTTGTAKVTFRMPFAMNLTDIRAGVKTAPTGASLIVDVNLNGTTVMTTTKVIIAASAKTNVGGTAPAITTPGLTDDGEVTVDVDQIGSTVAGVGLKIWLIGNRRS